MNASDVLVDVPGPVLPVIDGKLDDSFLTDGIRGGMDGEFYRQDRLTVLAGRLPPPSATTRWCSPRAWPVPST